MTACSSFKGTCDYCNKPRHKKAQCFKFLRESGGRSLPSSGVGKSSSYSLHNTHLHDNGDCRAQQQQRGNGGGSGYARGNNNSGNVNRRRHGGSSNTVNTAVTANGTFTPTLIAYAPTAPVTAPAGPGTAPPASVTS